MTILSSEEFKQHCAVSWKQLIDQLFPAGVPAHAEWTDIPEVVRVLNHMCAIPGINALFLPHSGWLEIYGAFLGKESGQIELETNADPHHSQRRVCRVAKLTFESFDNPDDYQFSYFRIQTAPLAILHNEYMMPGNMQEEVTELGTGEYASRSIWDNRFDNDDAPLPHAARHIVRILGGSMVLVQKMGNYAQASGTDDGFHEEFSENEFREMMASCNRDYTRG